MSPDRYFGVQFLFFLVWAAALLWLPVFQPKPPPPPPPPPPRVVDGVWNGEVRSATTSVALRNALIELRAGRDAALTAPVVKRAVSGPTGAFSLQAPPGLYSARVTLTGYEPETWAVTLAVRPLVHDIFLVPSVPVGSLRIRLTWGERPADLDLHVATSPQDPQGFHVYYGNRSARQVSLDRDDVTSFGPETITMPLTGQKVRVYVHDYTNRTARGPSMALASSEAVVDVYGASGHLARYTVDTHAAGTLWTVFDLEGPGPTLTPIHRYEYEQSPLGVLMH